MKITVKHRDTKIIIDEDGAKEPSSLRWEDQAKRINEALKVITAEIKKLYAD